MISNRRVQLTAIGLVLAGLACSSGGSQQATVDAISRSVSGTSTAAALNLSQSGLAVQTAEAQATQEGSALQATARALLDISEADRQATAQAAAPLLAALPSYGVDPAQGELAWVHPPATIQVTGYMQSDFENRYFATVAQDFVLSSDITWNTTTGLAGCGFFFRSDGNKDAPNQYLAVASRGGNGRVIFEAMLDGETTSIFDMYAYGQDPSFDWHNDATNRLAVVAKGGEYTFFTNGVRVGQVNAGDRPPQPFIPPPPTQPPPGSPPDVVQKYQQALEQHGAMVDQIRGDIAGRVQSNTKEVPFFDRGFVAMIAVSESGTTVCQFDNTWLWLFN